MGYEKGLSITDLPGALVCLLGALAQVYVGRRLRVPPVINYTLAVFTVLFHFLPFWHGTTWIEAAGAFWSVCAICVAAAIRLSDPPSGFRSDRREFLRKSTVAFCAAPAAVVGLGVITRKDFQVNEIDVALPHLPKHLEGLRLLQISDIHIGNFFSAADVARVVDIGNNLRPDITFVTGDLITTASDPLDRCILELGRLRAPSGVWGCMGNHELYAKAQAYTQSKAREFGIQFLRHEAALLKFGGHKLNLVGVDYQRLRSPYLEDIDGLVSPDAFNLLLSHNPDVFPVAAKKGFGLTLAGHTHGGQVNVEILGANMNVADFFTPYTKGLYSLPGSSIYVNSGLGTIGLPIRLGAPPEIALIRLCSS